MGCEMWCGFVGPLSISFKMFTYPQFNTKIIYSFIYYAICESLQGTRPIGYWVCHSIITVLLWVHCITL